MEEPQPIPPEEDGPARVVPRATPPHIAIRVRAIPASAGDEDQRTPHANSHPRLSPRSLRPSEAQAASGPANGGATSSRGAATPAASSLGQASTAATATDPLSLVDGSEIALGIPITDTGTTKIMRVVIILATIAASFYICNFNVNLMRGFYSDQSQAALWTAMSELIIELSVPACGYCGAMYNNRQLTCCFCCCNLFTTIVAIITFIRLNIRIGEIEGDCFRESNLETRRRCEVWTSDSTEKWVMLASTVGAILMGCCAFWFGNTLYNRLSQGGSAAAPEWPIIGEVISLSGINPDGTPASSPLTGVTVESSSGAAATGGEVHSVVTISSSSEPSPSEGRHLALPDRGLSSEVLSNATRQVSGSERGTLSNLLGGGASQPDAASPQLNQQAETPPEPGSTPPARPDRQDSLPLAIGTTLRGGEVAI